MRQNIPVQQISGNVVLPMAIQHAYHPIESDAFAADVEAVCRDLPRIVAGIKGSRIAMLGARPGAFGTVRFSGKILQHHKISVQTVDFLRSSFRRSIIPIKIKLQPKSGNPCLRQNCRLDRRPAARQAGAPLLAIEEEKVDAPGLSGFHRPGVGTASKTITAVPPVWP